MADLCVSTQSLRGLSDELTIVAQEFNNANTRSDTIAAAVGHSGLAEAVTDFAHGWDDRRSEMVDSIAFLAEGAAGCADTFEDVDNQLAKSIEVPSPMAATSTGSVAQ
ncbi:hypothetical protein SAMN05216368_11364 [Cryobacterium flavum]|uniref:WXG100 family type VII secretion target n=1 Tax=Cryobacterium flavum TaxID=1424659 RepID=A0A4R8V8Z7_9MICO|nr:hypothetical protein E3O21_06990 [Cryobacterium flavum]SDO25366.1 hypothetical protein SAMN05216368_11364 [Cryobacterium flavum]